MQSRLVVLFHSPSTHPELVEGCPFKPSMVRQAHHEWTGLDLVIALVFPECPGTSGDIIASDSSPRICRLSAADSGLSDGQGNYYPSRSGEMVDAPVSKTGGGNSVSVRL